MTSTKTVSVNAEELRTTFEFVSFGAPLEHSAYICVDTGKIYCHSVSAGLEEEDLPEDLETSDHYIAVPQERPGPRPASRASLRRSRTVRRIRYRCRFFPAARGVRPFQGVAACARHACWNDGTNSKTVRWMRPCSLGAKRTAFSLLMYSHERSLGSRNPRHTAVQLLGLPMPAQSRDWPVCRLRDAV